MLSEERKGEIARIIFRSQFKKLYLDDRMRSMLIKYAAEIRKNGKAPDSKAEAWSDYANSLSIATGILFEEILEFILEETDKTLEEIEGFVEDALSRVEKKIEGKE